MENLSSNGLKPRIELIYTSTDDHGKLCALLNERRLLLNRAPKRKASRAQYSLAEKIAMDRGHKLAVLALNAQIDALMQKTGAV